MTDRIQVLELFLHCWLISNWETIAESERSAAVAAAAIDWLRARCKVIRKNENHFIELSGQRRTKVKFSKNILQGKVDKIFLPYLYVWGQCKSKAIWPLPGVEVYDRIIYSLFLKEWKGADLTYGFHYDWAGSGQGHHSDLHRGLKTALLVLRSVLSSIESALLHLMITQLGHWFYKKESDQPFSNWLLCSYSNYL